MPYRLHSYFYNYQFIILRWRFICIATPCLFFILSFLFSCTPQKVNQTSSDRLYQKNNNTLNAKYTVYHVNDSLSQLFYEISNEILLYKKEEASSDFYSQVKLLVKISTEDNLTLIIDTVAIVIKDKQNDAVIKVLTGDFLFKLKQGYNYYFDINVIDEHKKAIYTSNLYANKTTIHSRQNFLITNAANDIISEQFKTQPN
jgi:hypothetical protein